MRQNGSAVDVVPTNDLVTMARDKGVPEALDGCHISMIGGYVVIGHVPIDAVRKLLAERPNIIGISIPGMPTGLPGHAGARGPSRSRSIRSPAVTRRPKVFMTAS